MLYREYRPARALTHLVECYWSLLGTVPPGDARGHRVLPDGCMDLLFPLENGGADHPSPPCVVGAMPQAAVVPQAGRAHTWGVRFRPGGAGAFLAPPAHELTAKTPELDLFWGPLAREVWHRLGEAADDRERVKALDQVLLARWRRNEVDQLVLRARAHLEATSGNLEISELAARSGLSGRQLERRFAASVGLSPKFLARIVRFRAAADALAGSPDLDKGRLALRLGYYDQAHFGRDFKELAGVAPSRYLEERQHVGFVQASLQESPELGHQEVIPCDDPESSACSPPSSSG